MSRVMFDIDGVLRDFATGWRRKWEHRFGYYPEPSTNWTYLEEVGASVGMSKETDLDSRVTQALRELDSF